MLAGTVVSVSSKYLPVRVSSNGTVIDWRPGKKLALVNLNWYDGFKNCVELVPKKDIRKIKDAK